MHPSVVKVFCFFFTKKKASLLTSYGPYLGENPWFVTSGPLTHW